MVLSLNLKENSYDIVIQKGILDDANNYLDLNRKVLVVTDSGVPKEYSTKILEKCQNGYLYTFDCGEENKSFDTYHNILLTLTENNFTRSDCIIAVGGGVVGDVCGFAASSYMRGIDFYNIPTTLLSQVDSSIGGKTAINFNGVKNIVGAFYQPKKVLIDPFTLNTLSTRLVHEGLVEAIKMAATSNEKLFDLILKSTSLENDIEEIIIEALKIKKFVVEQDPKEKGLRKILNFGHTIGHAIESASNGKYYHGECVGMGMLYFSSDDVKNKLYEILNKYNLPTKVDLNTNQIMNLIIHDKKAFGKFINIIKVNKIGTYEIVNMPIEQIKEYLEGGK